MPLKILFICRSCRDGHPIFFSERKWGKRTARGAAPSNPIPAPCGQSSLFRAAGRLNGPSGRKPPADGETLEKPRSRAQLFKRFCAKGDACALWLISPFLSLLAGLTALWAANRRLTGETPEKPRSRAQLFGRFCAWGNVWSHVLLVHGNLARAFARPQGTGAGLPACRENRCRARAHTRKNRVRARLGTKTNSAARFAHRRCARRSRAGAAGSPCIRVAEYGMLRARQNRQSSRNSLRGRADAPVPWKGPGDICARPCVCR